MSPSRASQKAVTPGSVKILMLVEAGVIGFLAFWVMSEYAYNAYFHVYADQVLFSHITTYSAVVGLGIGLGGSAVAAMLYRSLQHAKNEVETVVVTGIRGAVDKLRKIQPSVDVGSQTALPSSIVSTSPGLETAVSSVAESIPVQESKGQDEKSD